MLKETDLELIEMICNILGVEVKNAYALQIDFKAKAPPTVTVISYVTDAQTNEIIDALKTFNFTTEEKTE